MNSRGGLSLAWVAAVINFRRLGVRRSGNKPIVSPPTHLPIYDYRTRFTVQVAFMRWRSSVVGNISL